MTVHQTTLISVDCDIKGCEHSIACGSDWGFAEKNGWKLDVPIDDSHKDFCPECYGDLRAFLGDPASIVAIDDEAEIKRLQGIHGEAMNNLDDVEPFPVMDLRDVLAGEQPRPGEEDITVPRLGLPNAKGVFDA